jgi:glycosyltransferase involved in cell wall biosynthesis
MRVVSSLMFFPRGGSAHVARALAHELDALGHEVVLVSGSQDGSAERFYEGLDVHAVDFARGDALMHPSYEDRPGAHDVCFATVDDDDYEEHVAAWADVLEEADAAEADVLHLHHLTPVHEAAARVAPHVPVVGHLHGTELLMLEAIAAGPPRTWLHADAWADRMRGWAQRCDRIILLAESQRERAERFLDVEPDRCVVVPNGFDAEVFAPGPCDRGALWRRVLASAPRGWRPGGAEGSVGYTAAEVAHLATEPVVLAVGRFTAVKRLALLVRAFEDARPTLPGRPSLVLVGGYPGEWEGEHPFDAIEAAGAQDVFLAGWHEHAELADLLRGADLLALASVREQFGLVLVEAMASELPCVAVDAYGPAEVVRDGSTGWLVPPDDRVALAGALAEALGDPAERRRRGTAARADALRRFAWPAIAARVAGIFEDAARKVEPLNLRG